MSQKEAMTQGKKRSRNGFDFKFVIAEEEVDESMVSNISTMFDDFQNFDSAN